MTVAVTGATGHLGAGVARALRGVGVDVRLVARDPARVPADLAGLEVRPASYADAAAVRAALEGADTLYLVSGREDARRVDQHVTVVDAALAAGVTRIVYTSFLGAAPEATFTFARDHWATEVHLRSTGVAHTALRSSLYTDALPALLGPDDVLAGPAGDGSTGGVSWVTRDDVVAVSAAALLEPPAQEVLDVTGPAALTVDETVALLREVTGRDVRYREQGLDEARESRRRGWPDTPPFEIEGWVSTYAAMATGELAAVSGTVSRLTGRPATPPADWLRAHPDAWQRA